MFPGFFRSYEPVKYFALLSNTGQCGTLSRYSGTPGCIARKRDCPFQSWMYGHVTFKPLTESIQFNPNPSSKK